MPHVQFFIILIDIFLLSHYRIVCSSKKIIYTSKQFLDMSVVSAPCSDRRPKYGSFCMFYLCRVLFAHVAALLQIQIYFLSGR